MSLLRSVSKYLNRFTHPAIPRYFCTNVATADTEAEEMSNSKNKNRIVWVDMEMTGLDVEENRVLEVACLITDENLNVISDEFQMILHQPESELKKMDEWCTVNHTKSGLVEACERSTENENSVDRSLLYFMMKYIPKGKCPMAGNSVYMDRLFLRKYMPTANEYMHYRIIDVSSIKEVVKRWKPDIYNAAPQKELKHRAIDDIKESIQELDYYRKKVFNNNVND